MPLPLLANLTPKQQHLNSKQAPFSFGENTVIPIEKLLAINKFIFLHFIKTSIRI